MKITAQFSQVADKRRRDTGDTRLALHISLVPEGSEDSLFHAPRFVNGTSPIPVKLFQFADREVVTQATNRPVERGSTVQKMPCFTKAGLPVLSYAPGCALRLCYPGKTFLGYINVADHEKVREWLSTELEAIAARINTDMENLRSEARDEQFGGTTTSRSLPTPPSPSRAANAAKPKVVIESKLGRSVCFV